jgi:hypothetical protein
VLNRDRNVLAWQARAIVNWLVAARLVWARWQTFVEAEAPYRALAFTSYLAALDAEEAVAELIASRLAARAA